MNYWKMLPLVGPAVDFVRTICRFWIASGQGRDEFAFLGPARHELKRLIDQGNVRWWNWRKRRELRHLVERSHMTRRQRRLLRESFREGYRWSARVTWAMVRVVWSWVVLMAAAATPWWHGP